ncbi:Maf-like protein YhdE [Ephemeroptericola cinctiostellae]|uniref:dTTP/UTP pyrophosphatase n=1 Tax=Ephemeroptericola cinctiostellae TaxID=2268024 RepID=A0A345DBI5_9BURK|nr:Maf family protein [Ephemeroptericola cinctiostellae]AXF85723.1 Maf-like protein YhdE [Ephemeroptericola cinctiostellae]
MNVQQHNPFQFPRIYLASQSPRRAQLLEQMGVPFDVFLPEDSAAAELLEVVLPNEDPVDYVQRVSLAKLQAIQQQINTARLPPQPILCADTTVAFAAEILGKPEDAADARRILTMLSGQVHQVHTAVALACGHEVKRTCVTSQVTFKTISPVELEAYIDSGEPFGRAGAYAVQGLAATFIEHLSGSYSSVMGLPVFEVARLLRG